MIIQMRNNPKGKNSKQKKKGRGRKVRSNPLRSFLKNPMVLLKNPMEDLKVAGVPVIPVAIGAAAAILINSIAAIPQVKVHLTNEYAQKLAGPALAVALGFAAHKYAPQQWAKNIGAQVVAAGVIFAAKALAENSIGELVAKVLPAPVISKPANGFAGGMMADLNGGMLSEDMSGFASMLPPAYPMNGGIMSAPISLGAIDDYAF